MPWKLNGCISPPPKDSIYLIMPECPSVATVMKPLGLAAKKGHWISLTFKWRKATVEDQLEIAKLTLSQDEGSKRLGLGGELIVTRGIAGEQVHEDATVRGVRHFVWI